MLCKNCGKHICKSAAFCSRCGAKNEKSEATDKAPCAVKTFFTNIVGKIKLKKAWVLTISLGLVLLIGVTGLLVWRFFANKVDVTDYIEIDDAVGLSGYASLEYDFDYVKLSRELDLDDIRDIKELRELEEDGIFYWGMKTAELRNIERQYDLDLDDFIDLYKSIKIKVDNDGRLKNGDKVCLKVEVYDDEEFDKRLVGGELFFEVEDLDEAVVVDLFGKTVIGFSGENGQGSVSFSKDTSEDWRSAVIFTCNEAAGKLSNGDTVTVTATVDNYEYYREKLVKEGKHLPKTAQKKVTVEGLTSYADFEDINDAVIDKAFSLIKATCLDPGHTSPSSNGVYWIKSTENSVTNYLEAKNGIVINMASTEYYDGESHKVNKLCILTDISKDERGNIVFSTTPNVLFYATGMNEIEIISKLNNYFEGYELISIK